MRLKPGEKVVGMSILPPEIACREISSDDDVEQEAPEQDGEKTALLSPAPEPSLTTPPLPLSISFPHFPLSPSSLLSPLGTVVCSLLPSLCPSLPPSLPTTYASASDNKCQLQVPYLASSSQNGLTERQKAQARTMSRPPHETCHCLLLTFPRIHHPVTQTPRTPRSPPPTPSTPHHGSSSSPKRSGSVPAMHETAESLLFLILVLSWSQQWDDPRDSGAAARDPPYS